MTKELKIIIASVAALCIGLVVWRFDAQTSIPTDSTDQATAADEPLSANVFDQPGDKAPVELPPVRPKAPKQDKAVIETREKAFSFKVAKNLPQDEQELQSLSRFAEALYLFSSNDQRPELLVQKLTEAGLKPLVVQDFNEFSGKMIIVRTDETLPGTRYFHAQYFEDENKKPFLNGMSFEYRPGDKSLIEAVDAFRKHFPKSIGEPQYCTKYFAAWEYGEYTAYCKEFTAEDLEKDDATRARSKDDIGAVKCAVEQNPHPHEEICG